MKAGAIHEGSIGLRPDKTVPIEAVAILLQYFQTEIRNRIWLYRYTTQAQSVPQRRYLDLLIRHYRKLDRIYKKAHSA